MVTRQSIRLVGIFRAKRTKIHGKSIHSGDWNLNISRRYVIFAALSTVSLLIFKAKQPKVATAKDLKLRDIYIVTENCTKCKYTNCVDVCPVDAFREGETMLAIDPNVCINCSMCQPECSAEAIFNTSMLAIDEAGRQQAEKWALINERHAEIWPVIKQTKISNLANSDSCRQASRTNDK